MLSFIIYHVSCVVCCTYLNGHDTPSDWVAGDALPGTPLGFVKIHSSSSIFQLSIVDVM